MKKIGIRKSDPSYRKFYFDDSEILTTNPPKYKVVYVDDETGTDIYYVECSDVFVLKLCEKPVESIPEIQKHPTKKSRSKSTSKNGKSAVKTSKTSPELVSNSVPDILTTASKDIRYEYDVLEIDESKISDVKQILNQYGEQGWELCSMIESKDGGLLTRYTHRLVCILKRIK